MAINSIYKIDEFSTTVEYNKNDIVQSPIYIGGGTTGIPKEINYYYALKTSTGESPFNAYGKPKLRLVNIGVVTLK